MAQSAPDKTASASPRPGVASSRATRMLALLVALAVLALLCLVSIGVGSKFIPLLTVWNALLGEGTANDLMVVQSLRLPRTITGIAIGAALGVSGALMQALTRNPLADPGILGVNAGAAFAVVVAISLLGITGVTGYVWFAFLGATLATIIVYAIGSLGRAGATPVQLTLAGIALGAVMNGLASGLILLDPETFDRMRGWNAGSLAGRNLDILVPLLPFFGLGLVGALLAARPLDAVALGEDMARSLGANVAQLRVLVIVSVTLLVGAATAAAGPIGFVGLMIPHIARWIAGPDQRWILALSLVLSPILLLASDILGRIILQPAELPVGIVTAFVGAPVLIVLVRRKKASKL